VGLSISNITAGMRFNGDIKLNFRKMCVDMIPFPRLNFFINSVGPLKTFKEDIEQRVEKSSY
jgi:tubulin beta